MSEPSYEEIRRQVEKRFKERQGFLIHFSVYLVINLMLWGIWFIIPQAADAAPVPVGGTAITDEIKFFMLPLPLLVTLGWGIGLLAHFLTYYYKYGPGLEQREAAIQREVERELARRAGNDYREKPKRDRRVHLTEEGELEDVIDDDEVYYRQQHNGR